MAKTRPNKDDYYLSIARQVATRSTCLDQQYGAVLVNNDTIISTGYNGSPHGFPNCCELDECPAKGDKLECRAIHAEANAITQAGNQASRGGTLYLECLTKIQISPCKNCWKLIHNAGIARVVMPLMEFKNERGVSTPVTRT